MQVNKRTPDMKWETIFSTEVIEHLDTQTNFILMHNKNVDKDATSEPLLNAAHFVDCLYLNEVPFIIVFSNYNGIAMDMGWNLYLAPMTSWADVIDNMEETSFVALQLEDSNFDAMEFISDPASVETIHAETNVHLYFLRCDWEEISSGTETAEVSASSSTDSESDRSAFSGIAESQTE